MKRFNVLYPTLNEGSGKFLQSQVGRLHSKPKIMDL